MTSARDRAALLALVSCAILAGGNGVGIRFSNRELAPLWGATLRFALAAALLLALMAALRLALPRGRALLGTLLYGTLNFAAGFGMFYVALVDLHAGFGQILLAVVPLATLLLAILWRQERLTTAALVGVLLAVAGIAAMSRVPLAGAAAPWALLAALASAVAIAQAAVLVRRFPPVHPIVMNAVGMVAGTVVLLVASLLAGEVRALPVEPQTWLAIGYLTTFGSVAVFILYLVILARWSASRTAYVFVLSPLAAVILSVWLDDEPIRLSLLLGGGLVLAGVYLGALRPNWLARVAGRSPRRSRRAPQSGSAPRR